MTIKKGEGFLKTGGKLTKAGREEKGKTGQRALLLTWNGQ